MNLTIPKTFLYVAFVLGFLFSSVTSIVAATIHVPGDSPTIQEGLFAAYSGDTVLVGPGTYSENLQWPNRNGIVLISEKGKDSTKIDGGGIASVITLIYSSLDSLTVINGFTIRNGKASKGAAIYCINASPVIRNNYVESNNSDSSCACGVIFCYNSHARIEDNLIKWNNFHAISLSNSICTIKNNKMFNNRGAGIWCSASVVTIAGDSISYNCQGVIADSNSAVRIEKTKIIGNGKGSFHVTTGVGVYATQCSLSVESSTFSDNKCSNGYVISCSQSNVSLLSDTLVKNSCSAVGCGLSSLSAVSCVIDSSGGVYFSGHSHSINIVNCEIVYGSGIYCQGGTGLIGSNSIKNNSKYSGGGIQCMSCSLLTIIGNDILENSVYENGGGLFLQACSLTVANNNIISNAAHYLGIDHDGAALFCSQSSLSIDSNTISNNWGSSAIFFSDTSSVLLVGNTVNDILREHAIGISCNGASSYIRIMSNQITHNFYGIEGGNYSASPRIEIRDNHINLNKFCGIMLNRCHAEVEDNEIIGNKAHGIQCWLYDSVVIRDNEIAFDTSSSFDQDGSAIYCYDSSPLIEGNYIHNNHATKIGGAIYCYQSSPCIRSNIISFSTADSLSAGIHCCGGSSPFIIANYIGDNQDYGIWCSDSSNAVVESCSIFNNRWGIDCGNSAAIIHYNNIVGNITYGVQNLHPSYTADATYNWWGDPSGPGGMGPGTGDKVSLFVNYEPWLSDSIIVPWSDVQDETEHFMLTGFQLSQNYPNPFNPQTIIEYTLPKSCWVKLTIHNILGQTVRTLIDRYETKGTNRVLWDGKDKVGNAVASGIYFCRLQAGDFSETKKMLLLR
jgi:parallel beta-helix repeat protein